MDLPNTPISASNTTDIKIDSLQNRVIDIINKLQQAGLFRALVTESNGNRVVLDTAFGKVTGIAPDKLAKGDEILARLLPGKSDPTLKIEQVKTARQVLPQKIVDQLIKLSSPNTNSQGVMSGKALLPEFSTLPQAIKVLGHNTDKTMLQVNQKNYSIPRQPLLEKGDTLLLRSTANHKVELLKIQPESILKNALSNLLPRSADAQNNAQLTHLQKLISDVLKLNSTDVAQTKSETNNTNKNPQAAAGISQQNVKAQTSENNAINNDSALKTKKNPDSQASQVNSKNESPVKQVQQLLTSLSKPLASIDKINAESFQRILVLLSLAKPVAAVSTTNTTLSIPNNLAELHSALKSSPENLTILLRQIIETNTANQKVNISENILAELSNTLKLDLMQQVEQTINQLQLQKTTIRLNQELNQPLQVNLQIPVQVNDETTALKLKIKQRNSHENSEENHWEISLSFEFGLLGLISTNILLQESKLSAHFWAEKIDTKQLIDTHMNQFKNQLKKSGFELGLFDCFVGKPASQDEALPAVAENLVDIKV